MTGIAAFQSEVHKHNHRTGLFIQEFQELIRRIRIKFGKVNPSFFRPFLICTSLVPTSSINFLIVLTGDLISSIVVRFCCALSRYDFAPVIFFVSSNEIDIPRREAAFLTE